MLAELYAGALDDAKKRLETSTLAQIESRATAAPAARDALSALSGGNTVKVLGEIKRASPSKGDLAPIPDPAALALEYANAGASAISVLTEERKFKGSLADLEAVRAAVSVPLLRKDFIATEQQILEARAAGADIVLLIVAGLEQPVIQRLFEFTRQLGMTPFIETHNRDEVLQAIDLDAKMIGVNARNLSTFETDLGLFGELVGLLPSDAIKVAESAIRGVADVEAYAAAGADVVLVGEALVKGDADALIRQFTAVAKV